LTPFLLSVTPSLLIVVPRDLFVDVFPGISHIN